MTGAGSYRLADGHHVCDGPDVSGGATYSVARSLARKLPTRRLRRAERAWRADAPRRHLGAHHTAAWAAVRAELTDRGVRLPAADRPPRRWPRT